MVSPAAQARHVIAVTVAAWHIVLRSSIDRTPLLPA
jgi:hypothetical protein